MGKGLAEVGPGSREGERDRRAGVVALVLALAFCFTGLGNHPLRASDEPRVAGIAWEMQHEGSWLVPRLGGEPFLEHPPLFYAVLGASLRHLGATEAAARLPGAVASAATLLLVFALGTRIAGSGAGLLALLTLVSMRGFYRYSHKVLVDPLLALFVLAGYYAYLRALPKGSGRAEEDGARVHAPWLGGVYVAAALAFYVKGIVGIAAIGGPIAVDVLVARRTRVLLSPAHLLGVPMLLAVCVSWPLVLEHQEGEVALRTYLLQNVLYRIAPVDGVYAGGHIHGWGYYIPRIPEQLGWPVVFLPPLWLWVTRGDLPRGWNRSAVRFLASILPVGTLLLSIPGTKRGLYLLPFLPPTAVAIGAWIRAMADPLLAPCIGRRQRLVAVWGSRLLGIGYVASLAWNVFFYPFTNHERDLGPVSRELDALTGSTPVAGFRLPEEMRGALPFYTGRIPRDFRHPSTLASYLYRTGGAFVLAPSEASSDLDRALGETLAPQDSWRLAERGYVLYAFRPSFAPPPSESRSGPSANPL